MIIFYKSKRYFIIRYIVIIIKRINIKRRNRLNNIRYAPFNRKIYSIPGILITIIHFYTKSFSFDMPYWIRIWKFKTGVYLCCEKYCFWVFVLSTACSYDFPSLRNSSFSIFESISVSDASLFDILSHRPYLIPQQKQNKLKELQMSILFFPFVQFTQVLKRNYPTTAQTYIPFWIS